MVQSFKVATTTPLECQPIAQERDFDSIRLDSSEGEGSAFRDSVALFSRDPTPVECVRVFVF